MFEYCLSLIQYIPNARLSKMQRESLWQSCKGALSGNFYHRADCNRPWKRGVDTQRGARWLSRSDSRTNYVYNCTCFVQRVMVVSSWGVEQCVVVVGLTRRSKTNWTALCEVHTTQDICVRDGGVHLVLTVIMATVTMNGGRTCECIEGRRRQHIKVHLAAVRHL